MTITQTKITTQNKPIVLPDVGNADNLEGFRKEIRDKYKDLIKQHTTEFYKPTVHLTYEHE